MQRAIFSTALGISLTAASLAWGHGFELSLVGNNIDPDIELFTRALTAANTANHGGVEATFAFNSLRIDFNGPLWFSDGGPAVPAPGGTTLAATFGSTVSVAGNSPPQDGFPVSGTNSHEIGWLLSNAGGLTPGVYGLAYTASGSGNAGPFTPSPPLVVAFHTLDFNLDPDLSTAQDFVFTAAVPEPATASLAAAGLAALLFVRKRSRARR